MEDLIIEETEDIYGDYGIVKFTGGEYKGRFAYYDNDDIDEDSDEEYDKAVVYLGDMMHNSRYIYVDHKDITRNYTFKDLIKRSDQIYRALWNNVSDYERMQLLDEKSLIDNQIMRHFEEYITDYVGKKPHVFMSHSSKDKSTVVSIALDLKQRGISSWLDTTDILPGESIVAKIGEGLEKCDLILLFLSKAAVASKWVQTEWESTLWNEINSAQVKIIPIKLEECEIPQLLRPKKYVDFSKDYNAGLRELILAIKGHMNKKETIK